MLAYLNKHRESELIEADQTERAAREQAARRQRTEFERLQAIRLFLKAFDVKEGMELSEWLKTEFFQTIMQLGLHEGRSNPGRFRRAIYNHRRNKTARTYCEISR